MMRGRNLSATGASQTCTSGSSLQCFVPVRVRNPDSMLDQRFFYHPAMLFLLYLIVKVAARLLALGRSNGSSRDLEILVLQHQVRVLQRKAGRPRLRPLDRAVMGRGPEVQFTQAALARYSSISPPTTRRRRTSAMRATSGTVRSCQATEDRFPDAAGARCSAPRSCAGGGQGAA